MARHKASGSNRIGSLLVNPGGPGGSGRDFLLSILKVAPSNFSQIIERFDIIGFDPRGVGSSGQITCLSATELDRIYALDVTPETPDEVKAADALDDDFDNGCLANYGIPGLLSTNTENVARDMNEIRKSVGDKGLSFLGVSYGTYLGAVYATLFPNDVRALVLDGAYDPTGQDAATQAEISLGGFEDAFTNWVSWCESSIVCAFGEGGRVDARWLALREKLDAKPIPGMKGRVANEGVFVSATTISLYNRDFGWIALGSALKAAESGDGELLLELADSAFGRNEDGTYDGRVQASGAIRCSSGITAPVPVNVEEAMRRVKAASKHFALDVKASDFDDGCGKLPRGPKANEFTYTGSGPIVVVGGTNDPATPLVWAQKMVQSLGPRAALATYEGEGHGAVLDSSCVVDLVAPLLVDLLPVAKSARCASPSNQHRAIPAWYTEFPKIPGEVPNADVSDLAPLLGLNLVDEAIVLKLSKRKSAGALDDLWAEFLRKGWKSQTESGLTKTIGGVTRKITISGLDLGGLVFESKIAPMIRRLLKSGNSILIVQEAPAT